MFIFPTSGKDQSQGIGIKCFYYLKNKTDLSYCMTEDGKGQFAELSKDNSLILTLDEAVNAVNGLLLQLQRNGYTQEQVLGTPLP